MAAELALAAAPDTSDTPAPISSKGFGVRLADAKAWLTSAPPFLISFVVHAVVLGMLAFVSASIPSQSGPVMIETTLDDNADVHPEFTQTVQMPDFNGPIADSLAVTNTGVSVGQVIGAPSMNIGTAPGTASGSGKATTSAMAALDTSRHNTTLAGPGGTGIPSGVKLDARFAVKGGTDLSAGAGGGVGGAIDRITWEIARSLDDHKTLVIWLLDVTGSLKPQHAELVKRIDRVYEELGVLKKDQQQALVTAVVAFGEKDTPMMTEPTDDIEAVKKAIRTMKDDDSGTENTFAAISNAINRWGKYHTLEKHRRTIIVIAVTDEKGDDDGKIEETLALAKNPKFAAKIFVVGAFAPLGRSQVMLPWPSPSQVLGYAPADRGPESVRIERDFLPFWSGGFDQYRMSSGFGPWALSRLCRNTGGIFFVMDEGSGRNYDPTTLREYAPDYVPRKQYDELLAKHPLRKAVVAAADMTKSMPQAIPRVLMEYPGEESQRNAQMAPNQASMDKIRFFVQPPLDQLIAAERDRDKEPSRRWRAEYDLMIGRLLANKVRSYTYNAVCAAMKKKPKAFENSGSNTWVLKPDAEIPDDTPAGTKLVDAAEKARKYLNRVVEENPNTPWAELAQRELQTDLGFKWGETQRNIAPAATAKNTPKPKPDEKPKPAMPTPPPPAVPKKI